MTSPESTSADPAAAGWTIDDPVLRLRVLGSERVFDLATSDRWLLGSSSRCSLRLDDPSRRVSRRHALASREGEVWLLTDLGSTNGLRVNGERRRSIQLAPGDEVELGGLALVAESCHSMELHELLRRWIGWSTSCLGEIDRVLRDVRAMANLHVALILRGVGGLVGVARRLHRITLGDRPFVALGPGDSVTEALELAASGMLFVEARHLARDLAPLAAATRSRFIVGAANAEESARIAAMLPRVATIAIPPLRERPAEIGALLEAYRQDAVAELGAPDFGFRRCDLAWTRSSPSWLVTLDDIEDAARRLVALRAWGVTGGAKRLGITQGALSRWARRRGIPTIGGVS